MMRQIRQSAPLGAVRLGPGRVRRARDHDLDPAAALQLVDERGRAVGQRQQPHTACGEVPAQRRRDHAPLPGAPADRDHAAAVAPASRLGGGDLVDDLVGHGVVGLPGVAGARRHRREHAEPPERIGGRRVEQRAKAERLGRHHAVQLRLGLVGDQRVGYDARAVDQAAHRAPGAPRVVDGRGDR